MVYAARSFIAVLVQPDGTPALDRDGKRIPLQQLNGSWMACADCHALIERNDWDGLQRRYFEVTGQDERHAMLLRSLWHGFQQARFEAPPFPVEVLDRCTHEVTDWVQQNANPDVVPGLTCMLCGDVLQRRT